MASRHYPFTVTIPNGITQANAIEVATAFAEGELVGVTVTTPGMSGSGIAIAFAHQIVIPYSGANWIVSSGASQNFSFSVDGYGSSGAWSVLGFNTSANPATWQLLYAVSSPVERRAARRYTPNAPIPPHAIYAAARKVLGG